MAKPLNRRLHDLLETRRLRGWPLVVQSVLFLLILANVLAVVLETVEPIAKANARLFHWFEIASVAVFLVEYAVRLYACTASPREAYQHPLWGRLRFALTPTALVDLVAILPLFLLAFGLDAGALRLVRVLRVFKLMRYSPAMAMLGRVVYNERRGLFGALVILLIVLVLSATAAYYVEREAQPKTFGSIPEAMWWAMAALTTVGYGDVTPITTAGRIIAGFVALLGIVAIALPTGIIASSFIDEAELVRMLRPRFVRPGDLVMRKGDDGDSMFIVAEGEVAVELAGREPILLGPGQFFGELALLERTARTATVRAVEESKLLELSGKDFHELMRHHADLKDAIHKIAAERRAANTAAVKA